jgi:hypothetical protein
MQQIWMNIPEVIAIDEGASPYSVVNGVKRMVRSAIEGKQGV